MFEKIKENKLKSAVLGISAILFVVGLVLTVNNGTYAESSSDYYCANSSYHVVSSGGSYYCCPSGYSAVSGRCGRRLEDIGSYEEAVTECGSSNVTHGDSWYCLGDSGTALKKEPQTPGATWAFAYFDANGGTLSGTSPLSCSYNAAADGGCSVSGLPTASKSGYVFHGWGTSKNCTIGSLETLTLSSTTTYYACWQEPRKAACYENIAAGTLHWGIKEELDGYPMDYQLVDIPQEKCSGDYVGTGGGDDAKEVAACYEQIASGDLYWGIIYALDGYPMDYRLVNKTEAECKNETGGDDDGGDPVTPPSGGDDDDDPITPPSGGSGGDEAIKMYYIKYTLNGGKVTGNPDQAKFDETVTIKHPTKTVTVVGNENKTGATIGKSNSSAQKFLGWTSTTIDTKTAYHGSKAWTDGSIKVTDTTFKNLVYTDKGTATLVANWNPVAVTTPTVTKTGYTCNWNTKADGTGTPYASGGTYMPTANSGETVNLYAVCKENSGGKIDEEITENEKTGDVLIVLAWVIGLSALGYSIYYFKNKKYEM